MLNDRDAIAVLMKDKSKELMEVRIQAWLYKREVDSPQAMGKEQAEKGYQIYTERARHLERQIEAIGEYAAEFNIALLSPLNTQKTA